MRIATVNDEKYVAICSFPAEAMNDEKASEYRERHGYDTYLRTNAHYYFCVKIEDAKFVDIEKNNDITS